MRTDGCVHYSDSKGGDYSIQQLAILSQVIFFCIKICGLYPSYISKANFILINAQTVQKNITKFGKVQRYALLEILNGMYSTPTAGMEVIAGILPIKIHSETTAGTSCISMKRSKTWRVQPGEVLTDYNHCVFPERLN